MLLILLLCLCILFVGIMFTVNNTGKVEIDLFVITLPQASLSLWLIAFFVCGGVLGVILSSMAVLSLKAKLSASARKVAGLSKQLEAMKAK